VRPSQLRAGAPPAYRTFLNLHLMEKTNNFGKVYLIGAGPGDPGLLTLRAHAILEKADVVVYDRLVSSAILGMCNSKAKMVDVGKMPTHHKVKQSEINKLLVKFACEMPSATIARLKGGDPFVFGRGGEEALELVAAGVEFEVVPGVTSAIAVPAYAGIPVSHRGIATSFHIITGHEKIDERRETRDERRESSSSVILEPKAIESTHDEKCKDECVGESLPLASVSTNDKKVVELVETSATLSPRGSTPKTPDESLSEKPVGLDFETLAHCPGTLIFLMGIGNMDFIARRLIECGKDPKTPLAFIEKGTTPFQRTVMATLETAGETIVREHVTAPAITIMGGVVELGNSLAWRKSLPLSGKRLVVTRAAKQASGISARLTALGAEVIETPMIETRDVPPYCRAGLCSGIADSSENKVAEPVELEDLKNFDILAFTSTNGVESFFKQLFAAGYDVRVLAGKKIASVGKITEKKLLEYGIRCDYVPEDHTGEGLGLLLRDVVDKCEHVILSEERSSESKDLVESRILLLQGNLADDTLLKLLPKATRWVVYETLPVAELPEWKREAVVSADAVVFASTSAVENFVATLNPQSAAGAPSNLKPHTSFCIGRMTEAAARKHGFETITSDETTMDSLVKKIVEYNSLRS
jgi:uroporphyrin-III C-methyltransferase